MTRMVASKLFSHVPISFRKKTTNTRVELRENMVPRIQMRHTTRSCVL